jgi:flagellar basal-body rod protein FlgG
MLDALYTAATGMLAQQTGMDVIANNLANANTVGFKGGRTAFEDLLYTELGPRQAAAQGSQMGLGVAVSAVQTQMSQGALQASSSTTDVAIEGNGYLEVRRPDGSLAYTRAGNLTIDGAGQLVTSRGEVVQPPVRVPAGADMGSFTVAQNGAVSVRAGGTMRNLGTVRLAMFANPHGLENVGGNLFRESANSGPAQRVLPGTAGAGLVRQGMLEMANINAVDEMVSMITTQRAYEGVAKVVTASDEMLGTANGLRR